jgi:hypothetical protein
LAGVEAAERRAEGPASAAEAVRALVAGLSDDAVARLCELLSGLRSGRVTPQQLDEGWKRLPAEDKAACDLLHQFVELYIRERERRATRDSDGRLFGNWPCPSYASESWVLDSVIEALIQRLPGYEIAPASAPDARGDEASPAEEAR